MKQKHYCYCRHNQELEQEQRRLEQEAEGLAQRLDAVLQDKFASYSFDSDTPIDKTLGYLQSIIKVLLVCTHIVLVVSSCATRTQQTMYVPVCL